MEHEVFVPVPGDRVRAALGDPVRVARAVPGLQRDAGGEAGAPLTGRLKVRVGSHSITYRGTLRFSGPDGSPDGGPDDGTDDSSYEGSYVIEGDGTESRGTGSVKLSLRLSVTPGEDGTRLVFTGSVSGDGRVTELPAEAVFSAGTRLLTRFAENLVASGDFGGSGGSGGERVPAEPEAAVEEAPAVPFSEGDFGEVPAAAEEPAAAPVADEGPPVEAAHARRTMIGRSAEEVDHAPPRGRYAPVPAPETVSTVATLRWAAPAAALAVASAVVIGRMLRRRR